MFLNSLEFSRYSIHFYQDYLIVLFWVYSYYRYCALYGFMVKNFEAMPPKNISGLEDMCSFFSSGEVWSILAKTSVLGTE